MKVAVVGLGTAGATLAVLLHDAGHDVRVLERAPQPGPVGAGIWLQGLGQQVLERVGLLAALRARSQEVSRIAMRADGRRVLDLSYADLPGAVPALGVHRGDLFSLLHDALRARGVAVEPGVAVTAVEPVTGRAGGVAVLTDEGRLGHFDLVVGADGAGSAVRRSLGVARRDRPYRWGALWAVVDDPDDLAGDTLYQGMRGTREYVGVLPTGLGRASLFGSVPVGDAGRVLAAGLPAWRARNAPLAGDAAPLLDRVTSLLPATYRDVVVRTAHREVPGSEDRHGVVLVGDAAHAMSPQLGAGTSLALADAWALHRALATHPRVDDALRSYEADRRAHLRWYQGWTRSLMPLFQSGLTPLAVPRDRLAPLAGALPPVRRALVGTLTGDRTSPWTRWHLP